MRSRRPISCRSRWPRSCCAPPAPARWRRSTATRGYPFASLVNVATDVDGAPLILVSKLATHTANLEVDGRASLLLAETGKGDALAHPRLTVLGTFAPVARDGADEPRIRRRFLARHPKSELYAGFGDFAFWRMDVGLGASQWRLCPRRRPRRRRGADRCVGRRRADRGRGRRHRPHERRPRRGLPALRHQTARRARRRLALASASIPEGIELQQGQRRCGWSFRSASPRPGRCARCSSNSPTRRVRVRSATPMPTPA